MKNRRIGLGWLLISVAVLSFIITFTEGYIYYGEKDDVFRILLTMQNCINTFKFSPLITLEFNYNFISKSTDPFVIFIGYAYAFSVFTSPFCTIAAMYKALEKVLTVAFDLKRTRVGENIVIFGYNDDVKALLRTRDDVEIHILTIENIDSEEKYKLVKNGCRIHVIDMFASTVKEQTSVLKRSSINSASRILLFHESSVSNFSLLRMLLSDDMPVKPPHSAKIICRCEDETIRGLMTEMYNSAAKDKEVCDMDIVSLPELQVRRMYQSVPLFSYYENDPVPLSECSIHILIAGFGRFGREAVIQAMNLAVLHYDNSIVIDIYDRDVDNAREVFMTRLDVGSFERNGNDYRYRSDLADGELVLRFRKGDMNHSSMLDEVNKEKYTYAVISSHDGVGFAMRFANSAGTEKTEIMLRTDNDRRLAEYIDTNTRVNVVTDKEKILTLDMIISDSIDKTAKRSNLLYSTISGGDPEADEDMLWKKLEMFKRDSSKAVAFRASTYRFIFERMCRQYGLDPAETVERFSEAMKLSDEEYVRMAGEDHAAYDFLATEHRRWCCFMASMGWTYGEKKDMRLKTNPCFMTQEELMKKLPETVRYDMMPAIILGKERL